MAIDIVGPVEHNQQRYFLFTIIDHFTKFAEVVVLSETSSRTVWQVFYMRWIAVWGCPTYLLSDNGPSLPQKNFEAAARSLESTRFILCPTTLKATE